MCWPHAVLQLAILVRAVLKLLQFTSLWRSRLPNTGVVAASTNLRPCELDSPRVVSLNQASMSQSILWLSELGAAQHLKESIASLFLIVKI